MELAYGKKELEQIARLYGIKGAYKMKKAELITALQVAIPEKMSEILPMLDKEDLLLFEALLEADKHVSENEFIDDYYNLMELELVQFIKNKEESRLCVDPIIKQTYKEIDMSKVMPQIERSSKLRKYIISILNLYGVVDINWAVELFNRYYEPHTNEAEITEFVKKDMRIACQSKIMDKFIVEETIYALDKTNFKDFTAARIDKKYFIPDRNMLEKFYDETFYENNPFIERLKSYLIKNYKIDEEKAEEIIVAITMIARVDCDRTGKTTEIILAEMVDKGIEINSIGEINDVLQYTIPVINSTRKWINKGFTPNELSSHRIDECTGQKVKVLDIGRNSPCPCGSGKKYKKCCGK